MIRNNECINDTLIYTSYRQMIYRYIGYVADATPLLPINTQSTKRIIDCYSKKLEEQSQIDKTFGVLQAVTKGTELVWTVHDMLYPDTTTSEVIHDEDTERDRDIIFDYAYKNCEIPSNIVPPDERHLDWVPTNVRPNELNIIKLNGI